MKALISPIEPRETGYRVAEVSKVSFDVAPPLFWIDCDESIVQDIFWYDPSDQTIKPIHEPEPPITLFDQPVTTGSQTL
jgi:hypothetical protein